eukprot:1889392-Rhodomonas_salina.2
MRQWANFLPASLTQTESSKPAVTKPCSLNHLLSVRCKAKALEGIPYWGLQPCGGQMKIGPFTPSSSLSAWMKA